MTTRLRVTACLKWGEAGKLTPWVCGYASDILGCYTWYWEKKIWCCTRYWEKKIRYSELWLERIQDKRFVLVTSEDAAPQWLYRVSKAIARISDPSRKIIISISIIGLLEIKTWWKDTVQRWLSSALKINVFSQPWYFLYHQKAIIPWQFHSTDINIRYQFFLKALYNACLIWWVCQMFFTFH